MDHVNDHSYSESTEEEIFFGFRLDIIPHLKFQLQMDHENPFSDNPTTKIDFGLLVKMTPFEREKMKKESAKQNLKMTNSSPKNVGAQVQKIKKVAFIEAQSLVRAVKNQSPTNYQENRVQLFPDNTESLQSNYKTYPRSILKRGKNNKYSKQYSTQTSSHFSKTYLNQILQGQSPGRSRMSIFNIERSPINRTENRFYEESYFSSSSDNNSSSFNEPLWKPAYNQFPKIKSPVLKRRVLY